MIVDENGEPCSAKYLANEVLLRCLGDISSYLEENSSTLSKLTDKDHLALNVQLVKQATRIFKMLGVHKDDIGERYDPDVPWNKNMIGTDLWCVDKDGVKIPEDREVDDNGVIIPTLDQVPTICKTTKRSTFASQKKDTPEIDRRPPVDDCQAPVVISES